MCINCIRKCILALMMIGSSAAGFSQRHDKVQLANEYHFKKAYEKAVDLYADLAKGKKNIALIHTNYLEALYALEDFKTIKKYINGVTKDFPQNVSYQIDKGIFYERQNEKKQAERLFREVIENNKGNEYQLTKAAEYFASQQKYEYAILAYQDARTLRVNDGVFTLELAKIYYLLGQEEKMLDEYFSYAELSRGNLGYVKNVLQNLFEEEKEKTKLEELLIDKVQNYPAKTLYAELLIWLNLQQLNFMGAFTQAKALEKRKVNDGSSLFRIASIAVKNHAYDDAIKIYSYILENFKNSPNYVQAGRLLLETREEKIKKQYPVDLDEVRNLVQHYENFVVARPNSREVFLAKRKMALLQAFYLNEKDKAIKSLELLKNSPRVRQSLKSQVLMDLGDIYLLIGEPWESTLLYAQVERLESETNMGHQAKLKNAKLNYYQGNFDLAQSRLDILKAATSREISNDALSLSALIRNNSILDTSTSALQDFAAVDLLLFQNKKAEALSSYEALLKKYSNHSLTDEIWWRMGNMYMDMNALDEAGKYFELIQANYPTDIFGDDSFFFLGKIYELQGKNEQAREFYKNLIIKYPGTVYMEEARERYRKLRGDQYTQ